MKFFLNLMALIGIVVFLLAVLACGFLAIFLISIGQTSCC